MKRRLLVLNLYLKALDISPEIKEMDQRVLIQKAVYLGQRAGWDLGYRFNWYLRGPYSPALTEDYFALGAELEERGSEELEKWKLHPQLQQRLAKVSELFTVPEDISESVDKSRWLELLASVDFLLKVNGLPGSAMKEVIQKRKNDLFPFVSHAEAALKRFGIQS